MLVSVLIPTRNRPDLLKQTLESVAAVEFPRDDYEVIVIDNASATDETRRVVEAMVDAGREIQYIHEPKPGLHYARNTGALAAKTEILAYLDDDVLVAKCWLAEILQAFTDQTVGCAGGPIIPLWQSQPPEWMRYFTPALWSRLEYGDVARYLDEDEEIYGANYAIRKSLVLQKGGFSPDSVGEKRVGDGETGTLKWVRGRGWRVAYCPKARIRHVMPPSRVTEKYVVKRLYNQGGCDSYSHIRANQFSFARLLGRALLFWLKALRHRLLQRCYQVSRTRRYYEHMGTYAYQMGAADYHWWVLTDRDFRRFVFTNDWLNIDHEQYRW